MVVFFIRRCEHILFSGLEEELSSRSFLEISCDEC